MRSSTFIITYCIAAVWLTACAGGKQKTGNEDSGQFTEYVNYEKWSLDPESMPLKGRPKEVIERRSDGDPTKIASTVTYRLDTGGNLVFTRVARLDRADDISDRIIRYDENGRSEKLITYDGNDTTHIKAQFENTWTRMEDGRYMVNADRKYKNIIAFYKDEKVVDIKDMGDGRIDYTTFIYYKERLKSRASRLEVNGVPSPDSGITRYYYSSTGALDSMVDRFYGTTIYKVNQSGDPVYVYTSPVGGAIPSYIFKQYTYDVKGNWIRCITQAVETSDPSEINALKKQAPYMVTTREIKY